MSPFAAVPDEHLDLAATWIAASRRILCITGAGVSAESGLPTYRGVGGIYEDKDTDDGMPIELALSAETFRAQPALTWKYLRQIERACRGARPNAAHSILSAWEHGESIAADIWILTQNVDGLHSQANSHNLIEIHGNLHRLYCTSCAWTTYVDDYSALDQDLISSSDHRYPNCPHCRSLIRPDVVLFNEALPPKEVHRLQSQLQEGFDLIMSIGTSSQFPYIAHPVWTARDYQRRTIEINPVQTVVSDAVDLRLPGPAGEILKALHQRLTNH